MCTVKFTYVVNLQVKISLVFNLFKIPNILNFFLFFSIAGHFLLTEILLDKMIETAEKTGIQGRIINVSSVIHSWVKKDGFRFNDILSGKKYSYFGLFKIITILIALHFGYL